MSIYKIYSVRKLTAYEKKKAHAEQLAIDWQKSLVNYGALNRSWNYFITWADRFERIGRKYGLLKVFRENGII